jgi:electron transport complex protein RnfG
VRLDVSLSADGSAIANPIVAVKSGKKENDWEIDGITGATISSVAIANLLNKNTSYWVPRLRANLDDFRNVE